MLQRNKYNGYQRRITMRKHWKDIFRKDIESKITVAEQEYQKYKDTKKMIYLQQAGNKIFSAVENYLMIKYNKRTKNYYSISKLVENNKDDKALLRLASRLHYFFYEGELQMFKWEAEGYYKDVRDTLKNRMRNK